MKTAQETVMDCMVPLFKQFKKSIKWLTTDGISRPQCAYRGDDGTCCAIGFLIPDDAFSEELELLTPVHEKLQPILIAQGYDPEICTELQVVHDGYKPHEWLDGLGNVLEDLQIDLSDEQWEILKAAYAEGKAREGCTS